MNRTPIKREIFVQGDKVYIFKQSENKYIAIDAISLIEFINQVPSHQTIASIELAHAKIDYLINNLPAEGV